LVAATPQYAFAASAEIPYRVWVSKPFRNGYAPEWNAGLYVDVAPTTGAITGMVALDANLLVFKATAVYVIYGQGFDVTGNNAQASFTIPTAVASLNGCVNGQSVISTDLGVFFQSQRGIELIDRGLTQQYIGQVLDNQIGNIVDACLVRGYAQVRFLDQTNNVVWVYDEIVGRWSQFVYGSNLVFPACFGASNSSLSMLFTPGNVFTETAANFSIGQSPTVQTGWIRMNGIQGFARLYRFALLGTFVNSSQVTVSVAYNYNSTNSGRGCRGKNAKRFNLLLPGL
jgi:hypothetical protein